MSAFANMPATVKKDLCRSMVYALVAAAGDIVMRDGEQLDSWCVIVSGEVEVRDGRSRKEYHWGAIARFDFSLDFRRLVRSDALA